MERNREGGGWPNKGKKRALKTFLDENSFIARVVDEEEREGRKLERKSKSKPRMCSAKQNRTNGGNIGRQEHEKLAEPPAQGRRNEQLHKPLQ